MRHVKARLIESREMIQVVIVFGDCWDSASFQHEHRDQCCGTIATIPLDRLIASIFPIAVCRKTGKDATTSSPRRSL